MNMATRLLQASILVLLALSTLAVNPHAPLESRAVSERRLSSDTVNAQCQSLADQSTLANVSFVVETSCNVEKVAMDGCVPRTPCQICRKFKTELNANLTSCEVLKSWKAQTQSPVNVISSALAVNEMEIQTMSSSNSTDSSSSSSPASTNLSSPAEAVAAIGVALVALVGGVFIVKRHRQRRLEEEALGTPKDAGGVLVSVQSRTQIATI